MRWKSMFYNEYKHEDAYSRRINNSLKLCMKDHSQSVELSCEIQGDRYKGMM